MVAFNEIRWDKLESLTKTDKQILQAGEENVLEYTLGRQEDASHYTLLLLKILNLVIEASSTSSSSSSSTVGRGTGRRRLAQLPLDQTPALSRDEALVLLELETFGVMAHYAVSKLYQVISTIATGFSKNSPTTMASIFYPDGFLLEDWRPLYRILMASSSGSGAGGGGGGSGMSMADAYLQRNSAFLLITILAEGVSLQRQHKLLQPVTSVLESFVSWTTSRLQSASTNTSSSSSSSSQSSLAIVTPSLVVLITMQEARAMFDKAGGIGYMSRHLKLRHLQTSSSNGTISDSVAAAGGGTMMRRGGGGGTSVQQLYELCFCLWAMSFDVNDSEERRKHFHRDGAVPALCDIVAAAPREKVVRCALAALVNLANCSTSPSDSTSSSSSGGSSSNKKGTEAAHFLNEMIGCGLVKSIDLLQDQKKYNDPDFAEDLKVLSNLLHEAFEDLTRWDLYLAEVESGHLTFGVLHTEKFFAENAKLMEGKDCNFNVVKV
jgi:V-type H+-transporting ATPase subunit H